VIGMTEAVRAVVLAGFVLAVVWVGPFLAVEAAYLIRSVAARVLAAWREGGER
jgi:hypothetical protein